MQPCVAAVPSLHYPHGGSLTCSDVFVAASQDFPQERGLSPLYGSTRDLDEQVVHGDCQRERLGVPVGDAASGAG